MKASFFRMTRDMACHKTPILLALTVSLAVALRLYQIDRESLWLDEAISYWRAKTSPTEMITLLTENVHTPLYFLTLHYWMKILGDSDWAIRLLSAIFGISAIPVVFQIGRLLFNERFGILAALFLAVSGFHVQYSQEARPYSLYFLLTSLSVLFAVLAHKRTPYAWIGYTVSTVLLLYTHNMAVLAVAGVIGFYLALCWPWRVSNIYPFLAALLVVAVLYTPWIPVYASQAIRVKGDFWTSELTVGHILRTIQQLILLPPQTGIPKPILLGLLGVPFSILLLSLPALSAKEKKTLVGLALLFVIPVGINLIFSTTVRNVLIPRVVMPALLPLPFFWAAPILMEKGGLLSSYRKLALIAMALMLSISLAGSIRFLLSHSKEPWRQAAGIFEKSYQPGDAVIYLLAGVELAFIRYLPPSFYDLPIVAIPKSSQKKYGPPRRQPINGEEDETGTAALQTLKARTNRVWLVVRHSATLKLRHELAHMTFAWLEANYTKVRGWKLGTLELVLYKP